MQSDELSRAIGAQRLILSELQIDPDTPPVSRFSRLYTLYNGFMLGQFLIGSSLEFTRKYPGRVAEQVFRANEFLDEIGVAEHVPDDPPGFGTQEFQQAVLGRIIPSVAAVSLEVAEFALLSAQLVFYGHLVHFEPSSIDLYREEIERLCAKHALPDVDFDALTPELREERDPPVLIDDVLTAALGYLETAIASVPVESETAFVIMPFRDPYADRFHVLYRPALELAGCRAIRAWGGLSDEQYCDMLLALIDRVGFVWADISGLNPNVMYEVGVAHARNKQTVVVAEAPEDATPEQIGVPANIGHDLVATYSPTGEEWPTLIVHTLAVIVAATRSACQRAGRHRVGKDEVAQVMSEATDRAVKGLSKKPK